MGILDLDSMDSEDGDDDDLLSRSPACLLEQQSVKKFTHPDSAKRNILA